MRWLMSSPAVAASPATNSCDDLGRDLLGRLVAAEFAGTDAAVGIAALQHPVDQMRRVGAGGDAVAVTQPLQHHLRRKDHGGGVGNSPRAQVWASVSYAPLIVKRVAHTRAI